MSEVVVSSSSNSVDKAIDEYRDDSSLVIVALIAIVVVATPQMRNTPLVFLGSLLRFFKNTLG